MSDSRGIREILQEILTTGLLRIRTLAWSGDAERCAVEADHIHNLPRLLVHEDPDGLVYYWEVERTSYIEHTEQNQLSNWEPLWNRLQAQIEAMASTPATR